MFIMFTEEGIWIIQKRLYNLRIDNDLKQEDIAKLLQITPQPYGMYENKKRGLPIKCLITLWKFYDVSSDYILGLSNDMNLKNGCQNAVP